MTLCTSRLVIDNALLSASLSATPAVASGYSINNIKDLRRSQYAKTVAATSQQIAFNFFSPKTVDCFYLDLPTGVGVELKLYSGNNGLGTLLATQQYYGGVYIPIGAGKFKIGTHAIGQMDPAYSHLRPVYFPVVTCQSGTVTITQPVASVLTLRTMVLGKSVQFLAEAAAGLSLRRASTTVRTRGGSLLAIGLEKQWREMTLNCNYMTEAERVALWDAVYASSCHGVLVDAIPTNTTDLREHHTFIANLALPSMTRGSYYHQTDLTFTEI